MYSTVCSGGTGVGATGSSGSDSGSYSSGGTGVGATGSSSPDSANKVLGSNLQVGNGKSFPELYTFPSANDEIGTLITVPSIEVILILYDPLRAGAPSTTQKFH